MLAKIQSFVKTYYADIILVIGVVLISLFSFALGFIVAKQEEKEPIRIEKFQAPSAKFQLITNNQNFNDRNSFNHSVIGCWNLIGNWKLEIGNLV